MSRAEQEKYKTTLIGKYFIWKGETANFLINELRFDPDGSTVFLKESDEGCCVPFPKSELDEIIKRSNVNYYGDFKIIDAHMFRAEQVQAILDRTTKDITALKEICNDPQTCEYIDAGANTWLLCLHSLVACYKSDDI